MVFKDLEIDRESVALGDVPNVSSSSSAFSSHVKARNRAPDELRRPLMPKGVVSNRARMRYVGRGQGRHLGRLEFATPRRVRLTRECSTMSCLEYNGFFLFVARLYTPRSLIYVGSI